MKFELSNKQRDIFEKYYPWGNTIYYVYDSEDKIVLGFEFSDLSGSSKILYINQDGSMMVYGLDKRSQYIGHISQEVLSRVLKLQSFK